MDLYLDHSESFYHTLFEKKMNKNFKTIFFLNIKFKKNNYDLHTLQNRVNLYVL